MFFQSSSQVIFAISDVTSSTLTDVKLYYNIGLAGGNAILNDGTHIMTPQLINISPPVGTAGQTLVTATIHGVGTGTTGLQLFDGSNLCDTITVVSYSIVECLTERQDFGAAALSLNVVQDDVTHACAATDAASCSYLQNELDVTFP